MRTLEKPEVERMDTPGPEYTPISTPDVNDIPNGVAAAAIIAAGIGCLTLGIVTTLAEASAGFSSALNWVNPVGPLSGKTMVAVAVWLVSWAVLHFTLKGKELRFNTVFTLTLILIGLGLLGTFPIFFDLFVTK
jgi:hypothetical protein